MSTIDMSTDFATAYTARMVGYPSSVSTQGLSQNAPLLNGYEGSSGSVWIQIMKGTVPTDFSTLTNSNVRASDCLIKFTPGYYNGTTVVNNFGPTVTSSTSVTINTVYSAALVTGTATWLWWLQTNTYGGTSIIQQTIGTVGLTGSGADLEIPDVNMVIGNPYRILDFKLNFLTTWTY